MARKTETIVTLTDDIDGGDAAETITFSLDGQSYEIDLNSKHAKSLRDDLATWIGHARKAKGSGGARRRRAGGAPVPGEAAQIREWAAANGIEVPSRGRIPAAIAERYHAAG